MMKSSQENAVIAAYQKAGKKSATPLTAYMQAQL